MTRFELACFRSDKHHLVVLSNSPPTKMCVEKVKYSLDEMTLSLEKQVHPFTNGCKQPYKFIFECNNDLYIMHHNRKGDNACLVLDGETVYIGGVKTCLAKYHFLVEYLTLTLNNTPFTIECVRARLNGSKMDLEYWKTEIKSRYTNEGKQRFIKNNILYLYDNEEQETLTKNIRL